MKYNHIGIPTTGTFDGEIPLPHLKMTVSDNLDNAFGIQWQRYWDDAPYPDLVKTVPHVAFEVDDLDGWVTRLRQHGVRLLDEAPIEVPALGARILFCLGPDGERIELLDQRAPEPVVRVGP